jgi:hypothetical protein
MTLAREILTELSKYPRGADPHGQMDQCVVDECGVLSGKQDLAAADVKALLDRCAYASLCTDFVMVALDMAWRDLGGS